MFSHLMYPEVFAEFAKKIRDYSDLSVLPTAAFFYGLKEREEISVAIEEGKTLFIRLVQVGAVDADGFLGSLAELPGWIRPACPEALP